MSDKPVIDLRELARVLVDTIELSVTWEDDALPLRIELFESLARPRHYCARIWLSEFFRIQSTFPQRADGEPAHDPSDELILKEFDWVKSPLEEPVEFPSQLAARDYVLEQIAQWLTRQLRAPVQWRRAPDPDPPQ